MKMSPYGSWESIISPEFVCGGANLPWETQIDRDTCFWTEQRPSEGGRTLLLKWSADEGVKVITPAEYSVRTKIYVYGGSAYCVSDETIYFVNEKDQCVYAQGTSENTLRRVTQPGMKFAELRIVGKGLIALSEDSENRNTLVHIDVESGEVTTLVEGADFYSSPSLSPDLKRIAWIEWNHPNMSWDESSLWVGEIKGASVLNITKIAGAKNESVAQPIWKDNHTLGFISDRTGWWNLYEFDGEKTTSLCTQKSEFSVPQWRFNTTWGYYKGNPLCAYTTEGGWGLGIIKEGKVSRIDLPFNSYAQVKVVGDNVLFMAGSPTKTYSVYLWTSHQLKQLSEDQCVLPKEWISIGKPVRFPTNDEGTNFAYGYYYPPKNPKYIFEGAPPVIVKIHGGPTGAAELSLRPVIQFWTSRGFALFDVDYTGSTGYGRHYRDALKGQWGIADRDDIIWGVRYLVDHQLADFKRLYISGSSAGGFTLLRVLTACNLFTKAVCYYGVSDLEALAKETHKFEKHYLDQLVAPYPEMRAVYVERSPINAIDKIRASMLIFQGVNDPVVPPEQSQMLYQKLQENGVSSELVMYEGEGHGFRIKTTLIDTLERELAFFR